MDFLSLCLTGKLTSNKLSRPRLLLSAGFGSLLGTCAMFVMSGVPFVLSGIVTAVLMTRVAFGKHRLPHLLRGSVILWGTGTLLGGLMTSVLSLGKAVSLDPGDETPFLPVFLVCFAVSSLLMRLTKNFSGRKSARITVAAGSITASFDALCDSGCLLTEPISGIPVIIAGSKALEAFLPSMNPENPSLRLRMIPADGVCGHRLLRGFVPERVTVDGREVSAVIAADESGTDYGGFDGIVPAGLVR